MLSLTDNISILLFKNKKMRLQKGDMIKNNLGTVKIISYIDGHRVETVNIRNWKLEKRSVIWDWKTLNLTIIDFQWQKIGKYNNELWSLEIIKSPRLWFGQWIAR